MTRASQQRQGGGRRPSQTAHCSSRATRLALLVLFLLTQVAAVHTPWEQEVDRIVAPHRFSYLTWHLQQYAELLWPAPAPAAARVDPAGYVLSYFATLSSARALENAPDGVPVEMLVTLDAMRPTVEQIMAAQVQEAYRDQGIYSPLDRVVGLPVTFPPVWFAFEPPPHLLVISPRTEIASIRQELLAQRMDVATMTAIEGAVEPLDLSALVTEIGGLGATYPAMVSTRSSLRFAIETVAEEWLHQYLAFSPLGWRYVLHLLDVRVDYEVAQINESLAGLVNQEIGDAVWNRYYAPRLVPPSPQEEPAEPFDFRAHMRATRLQAEALLGKGAVEEAEAWMESRRQVVVAQGYQIRKLNQAYFAFYGTYADAAGSVTPIGDELRGLRATSPSLSAFLNSSAGLRSRQDLLRLLEERGLGTAHTAPASLNP